MVNDNLCMGCMREIGEGEKCPHCGFIKDTPQVEPFLNLYTQIADRYVIGKVLASGGDGVTYIAWDSQRNTAVMVREFLPIAHIKRDEDNKGVLVLRESELVFHDGIEAFLRLWRKIAGMRELSALIPVIDIVEENNTAYIVSEYIENITFREFLLKSRTGYISWEQTKTMLMPVLTTLDALHEAGVYHLGISPNDIIVGRDGKLRLTGFMISDTRLTNTDYEVQLVSGYAPYEQYDPEGKVGAWSDVYAFAAVIYRALIGSTPNDAAERVANDKLMIPALFAEVLPAYLISALHNALQIFPDDRIRTVEDLREQLSGSPSTMASNKIIYNDDNSQADISSVSDEEAERIRKEKLRRQQEQKEAQTRTLLITFGICVVVGMLVLAGLWFFTQRDGDNEKTDNVTENISLVNVPNFAGQSYSRISSDEVQNQRFKIIAQYEYSSDTEVGYIVSQSIDEGQQVPQGSELILVVSKGVEYIELPDVSGMVYSLAEAQLRGMGFTVTKIVKENDGRYTADQVIATIPVSKTSVAKGSEVFIQVWGEPPTTTAPATTQRSFWGF